MSGHIIRYYRSNGVFARTFTTFINLEYTRKENDYGSLYIDFPPDVPANFFDIDGILEVIRSPDGAYGYFNSSKTMWLIRLVRDKVDEQGKRLTHVLAYDAINILDRRIIAYKSGTSQASKKNMKADAMIRQIVDENIGASATDTDRDLSAYIYIAPIGSSSGAPVMSKSFAYQKLLPLLQDICDESNQQGFYMSFDLTPLTPLTYRFDIFYNCRGTDRGSTSPKPIYFSMENGKLSYVSHARDFTEVRNFVYAGGSGEAEDRVLKTAQDNASIGLSPFNRCEDFISNTDKNPNVVQSAANARIVEAKDKRVINGHIQQVPGCMYGIDYDFGDIVAVKFREITINVHLDTVNIRVSEDGKEALSINSRNLPDTDY